MSEARTDKHPLVVIVGPTGSGKSDLGIHLAKKLGGEIIGCDASQIYRGLDIGTAKVPPKERQGIPHHLIDIVNPDQRFSAGDYMRLGREKLAEVSAQGNVPIVVGGTGLYLRALLEGLFEESPRDPDIRARLSRIARKKGVPFLHRLLEKVDPSSAAGIPPNDRLRTTRALEIYFVSGKPRTEHFKGPHSKLTGYNVVKLGLNPSRSYLYERINRRTEIIFESGFVAEVLTLLEQGCPRDATSLKAIGYHRVLSHLYGKLSLERAIELTKQDTRRYAKRQMTWFRKEKDVHWLSGFGDQNSIKQEALRYVQRKLNSI